MFVVIVLFCFKKANVAVIIDVHVDEFVTCKRSWAYMTLNVSPETRCKYTTQHSGLVLMSDFHDVF